MKLTTIIDTLAIPAAMAIACTEAGRPGVGLVAALVLALFAIARASYRRPAAPVATALDPVAAAVASQRADQVARDAHQKARVIVAGQAPAVATDADIARAVASQRADQVARDAHEKARAILAAQ